MDSVHKPSRTALKHFCQSPSGPWNAYPKMIGVTGAGRTTTSYLIPSALAAGGYPTGVYGCLGAFDGRRWAIASPWRDHGGRFAKWMASLTANGCSHGVIEHCATGVYSNELTEFSLDIACITDLDPAGSRASRDDWSADARQLLDRLAPEGFAIINADDEAADDLLAEISGPVITVGVKRPAEITATIIERYPSEQTFLLSAENETIAVRTRLCGDENLTCCLLAAAVGSVYGIELSAIVRGLEAIEQMPDNADAWNQTAGNRAA